MMDDDTRAALDGLKESLRQIRESIAALADTTEHEHAHIREGIDGLGEELDGFRRETDQRLSRLEETLGIYAGAVADLRRDLRALRGAA